MGATDLAGIKRKTEQNPKTQNWFDQTFDKLFDHPQDRELIGLSSRPDSEFAHIKRAPITFLR